MNRRRTGWIIALVIVLIIAVPLVILFVAPMTYAPLLELAVRTGTGLQPRVATLEIDLFPPRFAAGDLELFNPNVDFSEPLLVADRFSFNADAGRFFSGAPTWWSAKANGVMIALANDASGRSNWYRPPGKKTSQKPQQDSGAGPLLNFNSIAITDLIVQRINPAETHQLHVAQLALEKQADERLRVELDGSYDDQPLNATGMLALPDSHRARKVEFHASVFGSELSLQGTVGHDGITPGKATVTVSADDLSTLSTLLDQDLSPYAPLNLNGTLQAPRPGHWKLDAEGDFGEHRFDVDGSATINGGQWQLDDLAFQIDKSMLTGSATFDGTDKRLKASLESSRLDIDKIAALAPEKTDSTDEPTNFNFDLLRQWTLDINAKIADLLYQNYKAKGMTLKVDSDASALNFNAGVDSASSRGGKAGDKSWRLVKPLQLEGKLAFAGAKDNNSGKLTASLSSSGIDGELDANLPAGDSQPIQASLHTTVKNFSAVQGITAEEQWDTFLPLKVSFHASGTPQKLDFDPIKITSSGDTLQGQLKLDRSGTPLRLSGNIHGSSFDVNRFSTTAGSQDAETGDKKPAKPDQTSGNVISDKPVDWSWLQTAALELKLQIDTLKFNQTKFRNVRTEVKLEDGKLSIDPLDANLTKGGVRGHVNVHENDDDGASIDTRLIITELRPADLGQENAGFIDGGETDFYLDLKGSGASLHQLAAGLNGEIALEIQRATIRNGLLNRIGSDILTQTVRLLNPFAKSDDETELECAAAHFKVDNGVFESKDQIVIETSKMKIRGGGHIDMSDETLQVDFVPSARNGVGIGVGDVAKFVRLGGTLANPQPAVDPEGILKSGATIGAAIATGGVSLLAQGLFNRLRNAGTACGRIFENTTDVPESIESKDTQSSTSD